MDQSRRSSPAYLRALADGSLAESAARLRDLMQCCAVCPRRCRADRSAGELGACGVGADALVSSYGQHYGEESVLVGRHGSGTIFFTGCNLGCIFCQNYEISQQRRGHTVTVRQLADIMTELQQCGCHNINFVSPTHQLPQIVEAVEAAARAGLHVPLVYNSGGYEQVEVIRLLEGIFDIYMPDVKYGDNVPGQAYSGVPDYWDRCRGAVLEMHRQVGDLDVRRVACDDGGTVDVAVRGLLVRHLVLPGGIARTENVVRFFADEVSRDTYTNIMAQYRPEYHSRRFPELAGPVTTQEFRNAVDAAIAAGLHRFAE